MTGGESHDEFLEGFESLRGDFERRTNHFEYLWRLPTETDERLLNWIGSIDYSGYWRQRCLEYLVSNYLPGDENRIFLRLSDWVPEVRRIAAGWILAHAEELPVEAFTSNALLILYLSRREKLARHPAMLHLKETLYSKVSRLSARELFRLPVDFRRYLYLLSLRRDQALRGKILDDPNPFLRGILLRKPLVDSLTEEEDRRLKRDKSVAVRRARFLRRIEQAGKPDRDELIEFAFDRSRGLRLVGAFYLDRHYGIDARDLYLACDDDNFYYISDSPRKEDLPHFLEGMRSPSARVRLACLWAISRVAPASLRDLDLKRLITEGAKNRKVIVPHLPTLLSLGELRELRETLRASSANGILIYLRAMERKSWWSFLDAALEEIAANPDETLFHNVGETILGKVRNYERLSDTDRDRIAERLKALASRGDRKFTSLIRSIEFSLRP